MCGHSESANKCISQILRNLYPEIQHQFVLIDADRSRFADTRIHELLVNLKNEFQSLTVYENKLVFPAVLKVFNSSKKESAHLPNIEEIQQLTMHKEQRILNIAQELETEIQQHLSDVEQPILKLISLFKNDFMQLKTKWNDMIKNWLTSCSCFMRIQQQFNPTKENR